MAPDRDAPTIKPFTPAAMPASRPYLPPTWAKYLEGDFYGLQNLATQLYDLATKGNPLVDQLRGKVNELIGLQNSARWSGQSADAFSASYGQDASMLSALNKIITGVAGVIDHLAERLASLEHAIEQEVSYGLEQGYFVRGPDWSKTSTPSTNPSVPGSTSAMEQFGRMLRKSQEDAKKIRELAAHELMRIDEVLLEMLRYYQGKAGKIDTLDPGGLLRQGQVKWYSPRIQELQNQLAAEREQLKGSEMNAKAIGADMQKIGGGAETVGGVLGLIKPLQPASETVSTMGGIISQLGEVTEHFGS